MVKVFVGRRLVKRLTKRGGEEDNLYFKDDYGEDDDDDDDDDEAPRWPPILGLTSQLQTAEKAVSLIVCEKKVCSVSK